MRISIINVYNQSDADYMVAPSEVADATLTGYAGGYHPPLVTENNFSSQIRPSE